MEYMIELHNVPHELALYVEELKLYGDVTHHNDSYPVYVWMDSLWDKDILETSFGVKKVYPKRKEPDEPAWLK